MTVLDKVQELHEGLHGLVKNVQTGFQMFQQPFQAIAEAQSVNAEKVQDENEEAFFKWLSPSVWEVDEQLAIAKGNRDEDTLQWVLDVEEFKNWKLAVPGSNESRLWFRGGPGIGKSTIAAYFITHLTESYPTSIVAYFFCKSEKHGLTNVRDIIRTLAYQISLRSAQVRANLDALRKNHFVINATIGVGFLFSKLLQEPLTRATPVYIVLDGLDEADNSNEEVDKMKREPEMEVFLNSLTTLSFSHLLLLSRVNSPVHAIFSKVVTKSIEPSEVTPDIRVYTEKEIGKCKNRRWFSPSMDDPVDYFVDKSNGIFLWVSVSLRQLAKAKKKTKFQDDLKKITDTAGDMEGLYSAILSRVDSSYRTEVKEILRWLISTTRQLSIEDLRVAVEFSLNDEIDDFDVFLEMHCGSVLQFIRGSRGDAKSSVQLIHETFRMFLVNNERKRSEEWFHLDREAVQKHTTQTMLKFICNKKAKSDFFLAYAVQFMLEYISNLPIGVDSTTLNCVLVALHALFTSDDPILWIKYNLVRDAYLSDWEVDFEEKSLHVIEKFLIMFEVKSDDADQDVEYPDCKAVERALAWRQSVLDCPEQLGEQLGKLAARLWLLYEFEEYDEIQSCFRLSLKYYGRGEVPANRKPESLASTNFERLLTWAGIGTILPRNENLGVAFAVLKYWDHSIACYKSSDGKESIISIWLGNAYMAKGDYDEAIKAFQIAVDKNPTESFLWNRLGDAYQGKGDYDATIKMFQTAIDKNATESWHWYKLGNAYQSKGDYDAVIKTLQTVIDKNLTEWWVWSGLWGAYSRKGDYDEAIKTFQTAIDKFPTEDMLWRVLEYAYEAKGDYDEAFKTLQTAIDKNPTESWYWNRLGNAYKANGNYDEAIKTFQTVVDKNPDESWSQWLKIGDAYKEKGDYDEAIKAFQIVIDEKPTRSLVWKRLWSAYKAKGDYDEAIKAFQITVNKNPTESWSWFRLWTAYNAKGDYDEAIKAFQIAVDKNPTESWSWDKLGYAYQRKGDYDAAIKIFQTAIDKNGAGSWSWNTLGKAYKAKGDYDGAIRTFQTVADKNPIESWPWNELGDAYKAMGEYDEAIKAFQTAIDKDSTKSLSWDGLGNALKAAADYDEAIKTFQTAVHKFPTESWSWDRLGGAHEAKGDYDGAIKTFQTAVDKNPSESWSWDRLGGVYKAKGDYDEAIKTFQTAVHKFPTESWSWDRLGGAYKAKGDYDEAIKTFQTATEKNPTKSWSWYKLGNAYQVMGDYDKAIKVFQTAIDKDPTQLRSWDRLGDAYKVKGDYDEAIKVFQTAIHKFPTESWLWSGLGEAYTAKGEYDEAIKAFQTVVDKYPTKSWSWEGLGDAYNAKADYNEAIKTFQTAVQRFPTESWSWDRLGGVYKAKGDYNNAIKTFQTAVDKNPTKSWSWDILWSAYKAKGDYDEAIKVFQSAVGTNPTQSRSWERLGDAYKAKGDYDEAVKAFQSALDRNPSQSRSWDRLGEVYKAKGDYDEAIIMFQIAVDKFPTESWLWKGLGDAYKANGDIDAAIEQYQIAYLYLPNDYLFPKLVGDIYKANPTRFGYESSVDAYNFVIENAPNRSILWAYLHIPHSQWENDMTITIDEHLVKHFLWYLLVEGYTGMGGDNRVIKLYETVIKEYQAALEKKGNDLMWQYIGDSICGVQRVFETKGDLSKPVIWSILGEVYKAKGDTDNAVYAFQKGLENEKDNVWLQEILSELRTE